MGFRHFLGVLLLPLLVTAAHADLVNAYRLDGGPGFSGSVNSVPWVPSTLDFSHTTFEINFAPQSYTLSLPTLDDLGLSGRLNSIEFGLSEIFHEVRIFHDFVGVELDPADGRWQARGFYYFSGNVSLLKGGTPIGSQVINFDVFEGSCSGFNSTTCTINSQKFIGGNGEVVTLSELGDEPIEIAYADFKVIGSLNDDRGTFHESNYSADWALNQTLQVTYDYTSVSEVPIPSAFLLFFTALGGLGLIGWRQSKVSLSDLSDAACDATTPSPFQFGRA